MYHQSPISWRPGLVLWALGGATTVFGAASRSLADDAFQSFGSPLAAPEVSVPADPLDLGDAAAAPAVPQATTPRAAAPRGSNAAAPRSLPMGAEPRVTNQARQALGFYGGYSARATLSQMPRRTPIAAAPVPTMPVRHSMKPFHNVQSDSTISPYLNLERGETTLDLPNYHTFVRPQIEQREAHRTQQRQILQLQRQLQSSPAGVVGPQYHAPSAPGTGAPARFMDTAQFYGGWRR